ncbi:unnamed protein product [Chrysodeixis includens]|uniref:Lipocalin/cytosolic fatty-acid binding domain-containing protein n=1 Tax=Chrysodeixis includens TaxID=689277 RepID=A0A9P0FSD4_CHRIL|nr:unnamed protein product [Chrysodeixis includens]
MYKILILSVFALANAAPTTHSHDGACPESKPVENFNLTAYQGVWYEISKIPIPSEGSGQCSQAEYTLVGDEVKLRNSHVIDGEQKYLDGVARPAPDAGTSAKFIVTFQFGEITSNSPLSVLATDYENYAIAYNCRFDEKANTHKEQAWILSRSKVLEGEPKAAVDAFLKDNANLIDTSKLVATDFSEEACKYTSSSQMTGQVAKP